MDDQDVILSEPIDEDEIKAFFDTLIEHPFLESGEKYPITMALVFAEGRTFMGGVYGVDASSGAMLINMQAPLLVREGLVQGQDGSVHPQVEFIPASFTVGLMDSVLLKASMVYQLKADSKPDQESVNGYAETYQKLQAMQAGIVPPSMADIANLKNVTAR